ncbi:MAG: hypothetical protein ABEI31_01575 [Halodesulfurarchaeum sp.]
MTPDTPSDDDADDEERVPLSELRDDVERRKGEPGQESEERSRSGTGEDNRPDDDEPTGPLSDLRADISSADGADETATPSEAHFHEESIEGMESEEVWADLLMDSGAGEGTFEPTARGEDEAGPYQVVPKRLCHRCQYFGDPPRLHCTHEGTTIHETVDMDHYRVTDCPMVRQPSADVEPDES